MFYAVGLKRLISRLSSRSLSFQFCVVVTVTAASITLIFYSGLYPMTNVSYWSEASDHLDALVPAARPVGVEDSPVIELGNYVDQQEKKVMAEQGNVVFGPFFADSVKQHSFERSVDDPVNGDIIDLASSIEDASGRPQIAPISNDLVNSLQRNFIPYSAKANVNVIISQTSGVQTSTSTRGRPSRGMSQRRHRRRRLPKYHVVDEASSIALNDQLVLHSNPTTKLSSSSKPKSGLHYYNCSSGTTIHSNATDVVDWSKIAIESKPYIGVTNGGWLGCRVSTNENNTSTTVPANSVNRFVSFTTGFLDGRGLGNQMFNLASAVYVAQMTGRQPALLRFQENVALDSVFDLDATSAGMNALFERRLVDLCPALVFIERCPLAYDERIELLPTDRYRTSIENSSIFLSGFFQSWKYVRPVARLLRERYFIFRPEVAESAERFMTNNIPTLGQTESSMGDDDTVRQFVRVGVHVRRGDVIGYHQFAFGYVTPSETYFRRAMLFFVERYQRVQFVVCGNDEQWSREVFPRLLHDMTATSTANFLSLVFCAPGGTAGEDLAILAACDHVIMSTGTFGWWAGWLADGTTVYYADWPIPGSNLAAQFRREDFFPSDWIGITEDSRWNKLHA